MIKVINAVVCDQVRREASGKAILIGVYGPALEIGEPVPPNAGIELSLWLEIEMPVGEAMNLEFRAMIENAPNQQVDMAFSQTIRIPPSDTVNQQITIQFPCRVDFPHSLRFELRETGEQWQILRRLTINSFSNERLQHVSQ